MTKGFVHEKAVSDTVEWYTPRAVFDALGVDFDLDVCSPGLDKTWVPASRALTPEDDGLDTPWDGLCWCNPPYGKGIERWLRKCAEHGNAIALVPARTDVAWFHEAVRTANALLLVKRRIKFHRGDKNNPNLGSPGVGNVFLAWGERATDILNDSTLDGLFIEGHHIK